MKYDRDIVLSKNVLEMITVAHEFCIFIENIEKYALKDIMDYLSKIAPLLYLKASLLPDVEVQDTDAYERYITEEVYLAVHQTIEGKFKEQNSYLDTEGITIIENQAVKCFISEKLTDIYQDLKDFIFLYQKEQIAAKENAVYHCKKLFEVHWGFRIISLLKALHYNQFTERID